MPLSTTSSPETEVIDATINEKSLNINTSSEILKDPKGKSLYLNKDPILWVQNDVTRDLLSKHGFDQYISSNFPRSTRPYNDQNRSLSKSLFEQKLNNVQFNQRKWMVFCDSKETVRNFVE